LNCGACREPARVGAVRPRKGIIYGAVRDKQGLFAAARADVLPRRDRRDVARTQVKLLRVLQEREAIPVGGTEAIPVDVRVVAATNRNLEDDIKRGRFRSISTTPQRHPDQLPPLRDRRDDIPIFVNAFLERIAGERKEPQDARGRRPRDHHGVRCPATCGSSRTR